MQRASAAAVRMREPPILVESNTCNPGTLHHETAVRKLLACACVDTLMCTGVHATRDNAASPPRVVPFRIPARKRTPYLRQPAHCLQRPLITPVASNTGTSCGPGPTGGSEPRPGPLAHLEGRRAAQRQLSGSNADGGGKAPHVKLLHRGPGHMSIEWQGV